MNTGELAYREIADDVDWMLANGRSVPQSTPTKPRLSVVADEPAFLSDDSLHVDLPAERMPGEDPVEEAHRPVNDFTRIARENGAGIIDEQQKKDDFRIEFITSAQLDSGDFTIDYHIDEAVPVREPGIIGAPSKALKTTLAAVGFMSMSSGDAFLGRFAVSRPIRCGITSAESGFAALQRTARAIANAAERDLADYTNLLWSKQILDLANKRHTKALRDWIKGEGLEAICLDPAYLMMPGIGDSANNLFEVGKYLIELTHIVAECGCSIVLNHHFKKGIGDPYQEPELEWLAHAGFINWTRWWWLMNRRSKYDPQNRGVHELWLHFGGSAGHSSAWALDVDEGLQDGHDWTVDVRFASEAREEKEQAKSVKRQRESERREIETDTRNRIKVQNALRLFPDGATITDVSGAASVAKGTSKAILAKMVMAGTVRECRVSKGNNQGYQGYVLIGGDHQS